MHYFLQFFVLVFAEIALAGKCPGDWRYFRKSCYIYITEKANWDTAQGKCDSLGGKLVEIEIAEEDCFVRSLAEQYEDGDIFIGGNNKNAAHEHVWASTGKKIKDSKYINWGKGQPSDVSGANCMSLWKGVNYNWDDTFCSRLQPFICEKIA